MTQVDSGMLACDTGRLLLQSRHAPSLLSEPRRPGSSSCLFFKLPFACFTMLSPTIACDCLNLFPPASATTAGCLGLTSCLLRPGIGVCRQVYDESGWDWVRSTNNSA
eukprot:605874-Rhodomonas_salina.1